MLDTSGEVRDGLISDVLLWALSHRHASVGRPRTYLQQLCTDTGCSLEDLPEVIEDRDEWQERERVREICAWSTTWWQWWRYITMSFLIILSLDHYSLIIISNHLTTHTNSYTRTHMCVWLQTQLREQDVTQCLFKQSLTDLKFFFSKIGCHTKVKDPSRPFCLLTAGRKIFGFITFLGVLAL